MSKGTIHHQLNEHVRQAIPAAMREAFQIEVETFWNFIPWDLDTVRTDGVPLTDEQRVFWAAFSSGYAAAMRKVNEIESHTRAKRKN